MGKTIIVDAVGEKCPVPVVKAIKALDGAARGDILEVYVDNEIAVQNLERMASSRQCRSAGAQLEEKRFLVKITATDGCETGECEWMDFEQERPEPDQVVTGIKTGTVAVIASSVMGDGEERLGKALMKSFLYALGQTSPLPETLLFYNSGIMLTTEGSDSLEDLKAMEAQGVKIWSCGTCLDYYGRKELLRAGAVTDMYSIVEMMMSARTILRP